MNTGFSHAALASALAEHFQRYEMVEAVALTGSQVAGLTPDPASDIDLVVFTTGPVPLSYREALVEQLGGASRANLNHQFWGTTDEWVHAPSGLGVDVVYWDTRWVEDLLDRVLTRHLPALGYSTAHLFTIHNARPLFDRSGWLERMQRWSRQPYPEALREAIIRDNLAVLRDMIPSYRSQLAKAVRRGDLVSVNHRAAGFIASYFDVIFAHCRVLHPGEKRLLEHAARLCPSLPEHMAADVSALLRAAGDGDDSVLAAADRLVDALETWLRS
jgi:hypothetical protein